MKTGSQLHGDKLSHCSQWLVILALCNGEDDMLLARGMAALDLQQSSSTSPVSETGLIDCLAWPFPRLARRDMPAAQTEVMDCTGGLAIILKGLKWAGGVERARRGRRRVNDASLSRA